jgi:hypothetical protein
MASRQQDLAFPRMSHADSSRYSSTGWLFNKTEPAHQLLDWPVFQFVAKKKAWILLLMAALKKAGDSRNPFHRPHVFKRGFLQELFAPLISCLCKSDKQV